MCMEILQLASQMRYISLPKPQEERRLSFYLAMEEYVARHVDGDDCFFMWQVSPTVIFGRNQLIENEVNVDISTTYRYIVVRVVGAVCMPTTTISCCQ